MVRQASVQPFTYSTYIQSSTDLPVIFISDSIPFPLPFGDYTMERSDYDVLVGMGFDPERSKLAMTKAKGRKSLSMFIQFYFLTFS
jgi:hypothetical protein